VNNDGTDKISQLEKDRGSSRENRVTARAYITVDTWVRVDTFWSLTIIDSGGKIGKALFL
jgi:hypothetical protein